MPIPQLEAGNRKTILRLPKPKFSNSRIYRPKEQAKTNFSSKSFLNSELLAFIKNDPALAKLNNLNLALRVPCLRALFLHELSKNAPESLKPILAHFGNIWGGVYFSPQTQIKAQVYFDHTGNTQLIGQNLIKVNLIAHHNTYLQNVHIINAENDSQIPILVLGANIRVVDANIIVSREEIKIYNSSNNKLIRTISVKNNQPVIPFGTHIENGEVKKKERNEIQPNSELEKSYKRNKVESITELPPFSEEFGQLVQSVQNLAHKLYLNSQGNPNGAEAFGASLMMGLLKALTNIEIHQGAYIGENVKLCILPTSKSLAGRILKFMRPDLKLADGLTTVIGEQASFLAPPGSDGLANTKVFIPSGTTLGSDGGTELLEEFKNKLMSLLPLQEQNHVKERPIQRHPIIFFKAGLWQIGDHLGCDQEKIINQAFL